MEAEEMNVTIGQREFEDFVLPILRGCDWESIPQWIAPYWTRDKTIADDLALLHAHLSQDNPQAIYVYSQFIAWKLKR